MTWLGKTLAVLNIVAALAFVYLAFQDYATREAWAYANYVHDVAVNGLPLDDKATDDRESPLKYRLANDTKKEWFGSNGGPVATQVEEVNRVKGLVDAKIGALNDDPAKQTVEYARILTPFARHNTEREWLLGVRTYLASPDEAAKLNKRLHDAFPAAVQDYQAHPDDRTFPEAFENACRPGRHSGAGLRGEFREAVAGQTGKDVRGGGQGGPGDQSGDGRHARTRGP